MVENYIETFRNMEYDEQLETLSKLWRTDNLDEYYECLDTFPKKNRNSVMQDVENIVY